MRLDWSFIWLSLRHTQQNMWWTTEQKKKNRRKIFRIRIDPRELWVKNAEQIEYWILSTCLRYSDMSKIIFISSLTSFSISLSVSVYIFVTALSISSFYDLVGLINIYFPVNDFVCLIFSSPSLCFVPATAWNILWMCERTIEMR